MVYETWQIDRPPQADFLRQKDSSAELWELHSQGGGRGVGCGPQAGSRATVWGGHISDSRLRAQSTWYRDCSPGMLQTPVPSSAPNKPRVIFSHTKFEASPGFMRPSLKKQNKKRAPEPWSVSSAQSQALDSKISQSLCPKCSCSMQLPGPLTLLPEWSL